MNAVVLPGSDYIVLHDVDRRTFEEIVAALAECHPRLSYERGDLELCASVVGLSAENYRRFLAALGDRNLRHHYGNGALEMMSPRKDHDWIKSILGRFIEAMALDLNIELQSIGSTTLVSPNFDLGVQPDEAYYVQSEARVRGKLDYDPAVDPPPDLVVEVDVTSSSSKRLPIYAAIGVPEIWRHDGRGIEFLRRSDRSSYVEIAQSSAFPFLSPADIDETLGDLEGISENKLVTSFVRRARERAANFNANRKAP